MQEYSVQQRRRALVKLLARHAEQAQQIQDGETVQVPLAAIELVYPAGDRLIARPSPLDAQAWLTGTREMDEELDELTVALSRPGHARHAASLITPGFVGIVLLLHALYRHRSAQHLFTTRHNHALMASMVLLDESRELAVQNLDTHVTDFPADDALPWETVDGLTQLLFTLDELSKQPVEHEPQEQVCVAVVVLAAGRRRDDAEQVGSVMLPPQAQSVKDPSHLSPKI